MAHGDLAVQCVHRTTGRRQPSVKEALYPGLDRAGYMTPFAFRNKHSEQKLG